MKPLLGTFIILVVLFLGIAIPTAVFIGLGEIVSYLFKLSLFNAALLCMGSTFVFLFALFIFFYDFMAKQNSQSSEEDLHVCPACTHQCKMFKDVTLVSTLKKARKPKNH